MKGKMKEAITRNEQMKKQIIEEEERIKRAEDNHDQMGEESFDIRDFSGDSHSSEDELSDMDDDNAIQSDSLNNLW